VALEVHHEVIVGEPEAIDDLREAIAPRLVIGPRHEALDPRGADEVVDALVVGRHDDARGAGLDRPLRRVEDHRLARDLAEGLAGEARRGEARRDDDVEAHDLTSRSWRGNRARRKT